MPKSNGKSAGRAERGCSLRSERKEIYLDWAASVQPNPSSIHAFGVRAKEALERARREVAEALSARPGEIIFTSGGTESNNLALQGAVWRAILSGVKKPEVIITNIEHPSVLETAKMLRERRLAKVTVLSVETDGRIDPKKVKEAIKKNTVLVSIMYANNEIGVIQPIKEIAKEIRHRRKIFQSPLPYFHTDAVQAANFLDLNTERLGVDMLSLSGSKIPGSGKVGVLYKKSNVPIAAVLAGGKQEFGLRPGTENLSGILRFANALRSARKDIEKKSKQTAKLRDYFLRGAEKVSKEILGKPAIINGSMENRLPNNLNITFPGIPSDLLVLELSERGIMVSEKSACESKEERSSHVIEALRTAGTLKARGAGEESARVRRMADAGAVRFSFGPDVTKAHADFALRALGQILRKLEKWYKI